MDGWYGRIFEGWACRWTSRSRSSPRSSSTRCSTREPTKIKVDGINLTFEGMIPKIQKSMLSKDVEAMQPHIRRFVERAVTFQTCPECDGTRLTAEALVVEDQRQEHRRRCARCRSATSPTWVRELDEPSVAPLLEGLQHLLDSFVEIGLGYLSLDRPAGTLSGGEAQRTKMIRHLGSSLTDVTYVFDEPTIGLHPHDIERMNELLLQLRDKGNTVLVVEHKPETIAIADHVVDLGPGAGTGGGEVCFEGTVEGLRASDTITGRHLDDRATLKDAVRPASGALEVRGASTHNLQDVDVDIPLGVLCVVTGVAGSGKSSLIHGSVAGRDGVVVDRPGRDQGLAAQQPGDLHRAARADPQGVRQGQRRQAGAVQLQLRGRLPDLQRRRRHLHRPRHRWRPSSRPARSARAGGSRPRCSSTPSAARTSPRCSRCRSPRPRRSSATARRSTPAAHKILDRLADVGLGYLSLGQPLTTLSGGERQRLKLATQMAEKGDVYVLDEPTTGLHLADVEQPARPARPARRLRQVGHRHRAPPGRDGARRLDHRPRPGRRPRRRPGRLRGHARPTSSPTRSTLTGEHLAAYVGA